MGIAHAIYAHLIPLPQGEDGAIAPREGLRAFAQSYRFAMREIIDTISMQPPYSLTPLRSSSSRAHARDLATGSQS
jgi:hypothetical protein